MTTGEKIAEKYFSGRGGSLAKLLDRELEKNAQRAAEKIVDHNASLSQQVYEPCDDSSFGIWREADELILMKLPGLQEFRISNEGAQRLFDDLSKVCASLSQPSEDTEKLAMEDYIRELRECIRALLRNGQDFVRDHDLEIKAIELSAKPIDATRGKEAR